MSEPFLSEIKIASWNYAPKGWALCDGQLLPINQNQALFSLLGTTYGGDGRVNFGLPDLRGRVPVHMGQGHVLGERAGQETHTITFGELPTHTHAVNGSQNEAKMNSPQTGGTGNFLGTSPGDVYAHSPGSPAALTPATVTTVGGSQPHLNQQPYLVLDYIIALQGIFPSPN
jgi:microcystin-dependent protein